jgi:hypothetical protein
MEDNGFLILRKIKYLDYNQPIYYPGNKNPYKKLIVVGAKAIIEKELGGEIKFVGYGEEINWGKSKSLYSYLSC